MITFSFPTTIHYGDGSLQKLPEIASRYKRLLLVSDRELAKLDVYKQVLAAAAQSSAEIASFTEIWGNPVKSQAEAGARAYKEHGAEAIIALGGGAALDTAKAIAVLATHPGDLFEYEDVPGAKPVTDRVPDMIAIPSTAGTGSEVGRSAVIADDETHIKKIIFAPSLMPREVLIDPQLTLNLPAHITAATGVDALTHLIEAYLAKGYHPQCDGIALSGLKLGFANLQKCYEFANNKTGATPEHIEARGEMMNAAMMGAVAFQKGLGANHSCAHALSTVTDMHHGLANAVMLNAMMRFNQKIVPQKFADFEAILGLQVKGGENFLAYLKDVLLELKIPASLKDAGVKEEQLGALVDVAEKDICHSLNPGPVSRADFTKIFEEAYE